MNHIPVHDQLPEFTQTHVNRVSDAIQPSHPLSSLSPPAPNPSQHQSLFQWVGSLHQVAKLFGASTSASFLPMSIQGWFPLGLTVLISLQSKELSRVFSSTTIQKHQFFSIQLLYGPTLTSLYDYWKNHRVDYSHLCEQSKVSVFDMLSRFVIAFLPKNKYLLISWLWLPSTMILEPRKIKSAPASTFPLLFALRWWDWMPCS